MGWKRGGWGLAVSAVLSCAAAAEAERFDLAVFDTEGWGDGSGVNVWMDVKQSGASVDFVFHNASHGWWSVDAIFFEDTDAARALLSDGRIHHESSGVDFRDWGFIPDEPPSSIANHGGAWQGDMFAAYAKFPRLLDGLSRGETLTIRFDLDGAFEDLIGALSARQLRVVQHAIGLTELACAWTVIVPLPPAAWPGIAALASLGAMGYARRRRLA